MAKNFHGGPRSPEPASPHQRIINLNEAAERLGISAVTLRRRVGAGLIAHFRDGSRIGFLESDIEAYIAQHRVPSRLEIALGA